MWNSISFFLSNILIFLIFKDLRDKYIFTQETIHFNIIETFKVLSLFHWLGISNNSFKIFRLIYIMYVYVEIPIYFQEYKVLN